MRKLQLIRSCFWTVLCVVLLTAGSAQALSVTASLGSGRGCADASCIDQTLKLLSSAAGTTGDLTLSATLLTFSITLPSSVFGPVTGADDNGVTQLELTDVTYSGSATVLTSGMVSSISGGSASISGMQKQSFASGSPTTSSFLFVDSLFLGQCLTLGTTVTCGIIFSPLEDANFLVNGVTRHFSQTMNLTAIPEPCTAMLLAAGLACLATRRPRTDSIR